MAAGTNLAPYKVVKVGEKFAVKNNAGDVKATFNDAEAANRYLKALYKNVPGAAKRAGKTPWTGTQKKPVKAADESPHKFVPSSDPTKCAKCGMDKGASCHDDEGAEGEVQAARLVRHSFMASPAAMARGERRCLSCDAIAVHPVHEAVRAEQTPVQTAQVGGYSTTTVTPTGGSMLTIYPAATNTSNGNVLTMPSMSWELTGQLSDAGQQLARTLTTKEREKPAAKSANKPASAYITERANRLIVTGPALCVRAAEGDPGSFANPYMMHVSGRFVGGERPNRNGAYWSTADLEFGAPTVANGPLNWLHDARHVIGTLAAQRLVTEDWQQDAALDQPYIEAHSVVWKWIYPEEAAVIELAADAGKAFYSMECISESVLCLAEDSCGRSVPYMDYIAKRENACEHMRQRAGTRRFVNPIYLGGGMIVPPVNPGWADAHVQVMREAAGLAPAAYEALQPVSVTASEWEVMVAQSLMLVDSTVG